MYVYATWYRAIFIVPLVRKQNERKKNNKCATIINWIIYFDDFVKDEQLPKLPKIDQYTLLSYCYNFGYNKSIYLYVFL